MRGALDECAATRIVKIHFSESERRLRDPLLISLCVCSHCVLDTSMDFMSDYAPGDTKAEAFKSPDNFSASFSPPPGESKLVALPPHVFELITITLEEQEGGGLGRGANHQRIGSYRVLVQLPSRSPTSRASRCFAAALTSVLCTPAPLARASRSTSMCSTRNSSAFAVRHFFRAFLTVGAARSVW